MNVLRTLALAFSMYSRIPMPYIEYEEKDMRYVFLAFPLVGIVIGGLELLWFEIASVLVLHQAFYAAVGTAIPLLVTGGFHMDGYLDTTDALSSHREMEKKLGILKDSHVGAFAVIWTAIYFLVYFGAMYELRIETILAYCVGFVLTRAMSGYAAVTLPGARGRHSLSSFSRAGDKTVVKAILMLYMLVLFAVLLGCGLLVGGAVVASQILVYIYYCRMSKKQFGGITGDLAGWYLQVSELSVLVVVALASHIAELF